MMDAKWGLKMPKIKKTKINLRNTHKIEDNK
jgi:hypothetical protein